MAVKITPHLVQLAYEAALKSFWRKESLRKFLRQTHVAESHLATWSPDERKRDFLDRTFAALQRTDKGKMVIGQMATYLAEQSTFPDLRNWEDSAVKIQDASKAVAELKALIACQTEEVRSERERDAAKARAREEREVAQRQRASISDLKQRLEDLAPQMGTAPGGYAFQDWFYDFLVFSEVQHRRPYNTGGRQIDGSITVDGTTYLVELKFTAAQAGAPDIDIFRGKVESKADNTMGVFVSMAGYSSVAVNDASGKKSTLLLLDSSHMYLILTGGMQCLDVIRRIRRHAAQTGEAFLPVSSFGG
ncbi:restriction endonuclease [Pseudomonas fragariae (ex Marin et al. 2024)]|uniref:restriction endonuclease n=1 Tax=Pseudomonas fragariae (ex Marin et al. 2024) TaxID=3080056 RepID=UPI003F7A0011